MFGKRSYLYYYCLYVKKCFDQEISISLKLEVLLKGKDLLENNAIISNSSGFVHNPSWLAYMMNLSVIFC